MTGMDGRREDGVRFNVFSKAGTVLATTRKSGLTIIYAVDVDFYFGSVDYC